MKIHAKPTTYTYAAFLSVVISLPFSSLAAGKFDVICGSQKYSTTSLLNIEKMPFKIPCVINESPNSNLRIECVGTNGLGRRKYNKEFKIEALNLAKELGSYSVAARRLGISDGIIHTWKSKYGVSIDDSSGKAVAESAKESDEVRELKEKIQELEKTNYILKRATAFFSQDHCPAFLLTGLLTQVFKG